MRRRTNQIALAFIFIITALGLYIVWPDEPDRYFPDLIPWPSGRGVEIGDFEREGMRLGLDLQGGTRIVLEADPTYEGNLDDALEGARRVIEDRVNEFGVSESEINRLGENRLEVQLPGVDPEEARDLVGRTATLDFRIPQESPGGGAATGPDGGPVWIPATGVINGETVALTGEFLEANSFVTSDALGRPAVAIEFNGTGAELFEQITNSLAQRGSDDLRLLGIFLDDELISAPLVDERIPGGQAQITGVDRDEGKRLSVQLNAGALPVSLNVVQQNDVDATLGEETVLDTVRAGELALIAVAVFMIVYYRLPGLLATGALFTYTVVLLSIFKLWPVTITLSGIAAFVLSVGMAVDANILIFERMKEELRAGRSLQASIDTGFSRAWSSIRDSNISTLITAGILYWFGDQFAESLVKGFAITLAIGVLVSMITAIVVTRTFLHAVIGTPLARRLGLFASDIPERPQGGRPVPRGAKAEEVS
ncbi:MAG TPA: protein translocase subunit SecD [Dehalococcoidia bacterium]|nr:protein translocase subunit SecD [Dehalococcoidia bacterium]